MRKWLAGVIIIAIVAGGWFWLRRGRASENDEEQIATVEAWRGDLRVSVAATGVLEPLTTVELRSRSGGEIERMYVDAGDYVQRGDLIAQLDPTDLQAQVDQAAAQVQAAEARVKQSRYSADAQSEQTYSSVEEARASLSTARARLGQAEAQLEQTITTTEDSIEQAQARLKSAEAQLAQARAQEEAQPDLTDSDIRQAEASLERAKQDLAVLESGNRPQEIAQARARVGEAEAVLENAQAELERSERLFERGFVSEQELDSSRRAVRTSEAQLASAREALSLTEAGPRPEEVERARAAVRQAEASLQSARAQSMQVDVRSRAREVAESSVSEARAALRSAEAQRRQIDVRRGDVEAAERAVDQAGAGLKRAESGELTTRAQEQSVTASRAELQRARSSLDDVRYSFVHTTIVAPRDGVVLEKHVEEGTVVPAGTAAVAQGTAIVTIADITEMYVMADVDEVDISRVKIGQSADINVETLPGVKITGEVEKIFPQGREEGNVVYFQARVRVIDQHEDLRPGMTVDVDILTAEALDVLLVPDAAIDRSGDTPVVEVLPPGAEEPVVREVETGVTNWEETEIVSGLEENEMVVLPTGFGPVRPDGRDGERGGADARRTTRMIQRAR